MLRALPATRLTPTYGHVFLTPRLVTLNRSFTSGLPSLKPALTSKPADVKSAAGVEGPHGHDFTSSQTPSSAISKADHAGKAKVTGDWVLFHPVYTPEELHSVKVMHREAKTMSDKVAAGFVRLLRFGFDLVSRYKHKEIPPNSKMTVAELRKGGYIMDERQWLDRILFLETTAAVPGMAAATLRHLRSLRLMKRDAGWIHTLLEEAENERMHLMTFMTLRKPSIFFRALVLGAQGVMYNLFFLCYMVSPSTCHRFVGLIEEEAVLTYTRCIKEMEAGYLPEWTDLPAPEIAKDYWRLDPSAKLLDVMYAVRSDESTHRFVNHSLANLDQKNDINPFALREPDMTVKGGKIGFEREEAVQYVKDAYKIMEEGREQSR